MHPVLFEAGGFAVYTYGLFVALALAAAFAMALRRATAWGFPREMVLDLLFLLFVSGVIGARAFYVLQHLDDYAAAPLRALSLREGGLVWYGGFLTAASAGLVYAWKRRWPVLRLCDFFAPVTAVAHAIGRVGCFLNGCCYGRETAGPWGVAFPGDLVRRLPVQLFEAAGLLALALAIELAFPRSRRDGTRFIAYLIGYGTLRFLLETMRGDQAEVLGLTPPQWTSALLVAGGAALYAALRRRGA